MIAMAQEWVVTFTPRRPGETVGACTVSRNGFTYSGSLNNDIQETVDAFWKEAAQAEKAFIAAASRNDETEASIKASAP